MPTGTKTGHLAYYDPGTASLMAVPFDPMRLELKGVPAPVLEGIEGTRGPFGLFAVSDAGALVYGPGTPGGSGSTLVWVDRNGTDQPLRGPRAYTAARLSPDGQRVAVAISGESSDIWTYDIKTGTVNRLTSEGDSINPIWSSDSKTVIYERRPPNGAVLAVPADGSAPPTMLANTASTSLIKERTEPISPSSVSPDGKTLIGELPLERQFFVLPLSEPPSSDARPSAFLDSRFRKFHPAFSPNGKWVAYRSDDTGRPDVYVTPYPGPGPRFPISTEGGDRPRWSSSGRELFYLNGNKMMAADVETSPQFRAATPKILFAGNYSNSYDVDTDGKRFLMIKLPTSEPSAADRVEVVLGWFEELKASVPMK